MTNSRGDFPDHLSFSQRYDYEPLPEPMRLEEISDDLRRELWNATYAFLNRNSQLNTMEPAVYFNTPVREFVKRAWGRFDKIPESRVRTNYSAVLRDFEFVLMRRKFNRVLELLEIMVDEQEDSDEFATKITTLFDRHGAAYWLDTSRRPFRFVPRASKEQAESTRQAIETLRQGGVDGASAHLRQAKEHINAEQYGDSIADSIHAVESVARVIDPKSNKMLGPALNSLEKAGLLKHPALKEAFKKLYGYTNDEQGIRHALLDKGSPDVGLDEAMFMFGACASFAAYLVSKHEKAKKGGDQ